MEKTAPFLEYVSPLHALSEEVAQFIRAEYGNVKPEQIETKSANSLVSHVDKTAEKMIVEGLSKLLPEAGFITEEDSVKNEEKEFTWIIDPLDGTTNFLYNIPVFSISIALSHNGEYVLGLIYDVMMKDVYHAVKSHGAYKNNKYITVSDNMLHHSIIATGFPYSDDYDRDLYMKMLEEVQRRSRGFRRLGSAALDLAYVASGSFGGYYENFLNIWDVAAGIVLVREAGGMVSDFRGHTLFHKGGIIAGSPFVYSELLDIVVNNTDRGAFHI